MPRSLMLVPAGKANGLFVISLGLARALKDKGVKAEVFRPLDVCMNCKDQCPKNYSVSLMQAIQLLSGGKQQELIETISANYQRLIQDTGAEVVIVEGVVTTMFDQHTMNAAIREAVDGDICMASMGMCQRAMALVRIALGAFGKAAEQRFIGGVLFNYDAPYDAAEIKKLVLSGPKGAGGMAGCKKEDGQGGDGGAHCTPFAMIPFEPQNYAFRARDLARFIGGEVSGDCSTRAFGLAFTAEEATESDVLVTSSVPASTRAAVVVLCGGAQGSAGKATITTPHSVLAVTEALLDVPPMLPADDSERAERVAAFSAGLYDKALIDHLTR